MFKRIAKDVDIGLLLVFLSAFFLPKIGILDLKIVAFILLAVTHLTNFKTKLLKYSLFNVFLLSLTSLIVLFLFNAAVNVLSGETGANFYILFRYIRASISVACLFIYFSSRRFKTQVFLKTFFCAIFFHIIAILLSMVMPQIRPFIYIISGYTAKELALRSSGLVSGYDVAGFYLNITFLANVFYNLRYKNRPFSFFTLLIVLSVVFTSRFNTLFLVAQLLLVFIYLAIKKKLSLFLGIVIIVPVVLVGSIFSILTLSFLSEIKEFMLSRFEWVRSLNEIVFYSYSESNVFETASSHYQIEPNINWFSGNGYSAPHDPGIINTIYEGGIVAAIIKAFTYLFIGMKAFKHRKMSLLSFLTAYICIVTLLYDLKLIFLFASGVFELMVMFVIASRQETVFVKSFSYLNKENYLCRNVLQS